jgi:protoporphyrinogen oxidase
VGGEIVTGLIRLIVGKSFLHSSKNVIVIGAGPAGLTAALELSKSGVRTRVLESGAIPGGLARTQQYKGYRFDIGGHRFFTKVREVEKIWSELLGDDFVSRPRLSRIYYQGRYFKYPLEPWDALRNLGLGESLVCGLSFLRARLAPVRPETTFDAWVSNRFGRRLFRTFFKTYTEKVWGMPCSEIDADWAAQRIRGLSIPALLKDLLLPKPKDKQKLVTTLIDSFHYPRLGPGMMWEACARQVEQLGGAVLYKTAVEKICWEKERVLRVCSGDGAAYEGSDFISTMPIRDLIRALDPAPPPEVLEAASGLRYRDFIVAAVILDRAEVFPDNWIYVHDPLVKVGRIQNFKNWNPEMVPSPERTCLGLEYFCIEDDALWKSSDRELLDLAAKELECLGIAPASAVVDGTVLRVKKAYPVYDGPHKACLGVIRKFVSTLSNLQLVGRNGMHHYNNQDHSMLTGLLAARNVLGADHDVWRVNSAPEYLESGVVLDEKELASLRATQPRVPEKASTTSAM